MPNASQTIAAFVTAAKPLLSHIEPRNTCITQSRIIIETLRRLGVSARPICTSLIIECSTIEVAFVCGFTGAELARMRASAKDWESEYDADPVWRGHICVLTGNGFFIDATLDQASRPARGLLIDRGIIAVPIGTEFNPKRSVIEIGLKTIDDLDLTVKYVPKTDRTYQQSRAWELDEDMRLVCDILHYETRSLLDA